MQTPLLEKELLYEQQIAERLPHVPVETTVIGGTEHIGNWFNGFDVPWELHAPKNPADLRSNLAFKIMAGLGADQEAYTDLAVAFAERGVMSLTDKQPRFSGFDLLTPVLRPTSLAAKAGWAAMRGAMKSQELTETYGPIERFILVGHSWGGDKSKQIGLRHPQHVAAIEFFESVGLETHSMLEMGRRTLAFFLHEGSQNYGNPYFHRTDFFAKQMLHMFGNPLLVIPEILAALRAHATEYLETLAENGIDIEVMLGELDSLVLAMNNAKVRNQLPDGHLRIIKGLDHLAPQTQAGVVADHCLDMLESSGVLPKPAPVAA